MHRSSWLNNQQNAVVKSDATVIACLQRLDGQPSTQGLRAEQQPSPSEQANPRQTLSISARVSAKRTMAATTKSCPDGLQETSPELPMQTHRQN
ncbi:MAG: hypothetical protein CMN97_01275 [Synechococcus sp. NAT40]|nr:hypothetical protein [Synechococcus sp. NAT40]